MTKALIGTPDEPPRKKRTPKLRDGVVKRGSTWSYVVRVKDPETGESRPRWVGGFATEDEAKEARDEARVKARRGESKGVVGVPLCGSHPSVLPASPTAVSPRAISGPTFSTPGRATARPSNPFPRAMCCPSPGVAVPAVPASSVQVRLGRLRSLGRLKPSQPKSRPRLHLRK
ncbi:Arm DNA-binding domain-containing protein [Nonomuraea sp. H19]|uniref:Arm DNA-binding domain-containing protein n=1 Tax=Nonomuraea sp. H19 TaxID=3452206 RepID=UPI003F8968D5